MHKEYVPYLLFLVQTPGTYHLRTGAVSAIVSARPRPMLSRLTYAVRIATPNLLTVTLVRSCEGDAHTDR